MPVAVAIPSARDVPLSMNQGIPVIEAAPRTMVARKFKSTAHLLNGHDGRAGSNGSATPKRGILARLKGDHETQ
jgi:septum formation inhibitor-activating ATPase MinD